MEIKEPKYKYLVVGGTSGIGLSIVREIASKKNSAITIVGHNQERLDKVKEELISFYDSNNCSYLNQYIYTELIDLSDSEDAFEKFRLVFQRENSFDGICYSAGVKHPIKVSNLKVKQVYQLININAVSCMFMLKAFVRAKPKEHKCAVVCISSIAALYPTPSVAAYGFTKAGLNMFVKDASIELAERNIFINAVCPAYTDTPMVSIGDEYFGDIIRKYQCMGLIPPEVVAKKSFELMQVEGLYTTGSAIAINAGMFPV